MHFLQKVFTSAKQERRLGDQLWEHLRDINKNDKDASIAWDRIKLELFKLLAPKSD